MSFFEKIIFGIDSWKMTTPTNFGWFHILSVVLCAAITVALCIFYKDAKDKTMRRIALISWLIMVVLEAMKQLTYSYDGKALEWDYQWYAFPYQLCSTPLYVLPFIAFMKDCKVRDAMMSYMSTFSFFGGFAVFIYPNDVFVSTTAINIQTMIHHGLQIVLGIYFFVYNRKKLSIKYHLSALFVFVALAIVAIALNEIVHASLIANGNDETFNMFYFSPHHGTHLPILSIICPLVPPVVFIFIYVLGFMGTSFVVYYAMIGIKALALTIKRKCSN
ncbi:MAG: hypothetical protein E7382_05155 [Clostridiales bacterium]|nr:hypothetical protein [Clostridiales bacterium]